MAMNKKEIVAHNVVVHALRIRSALMWTLPIAPDVPPPGHGDYTSGSMSLTKGFLHNAYSSRVEPACSSSISHNFGSNERTNQQRAVWLYSTRVLALRAMRYEVERQSAVRLMEIDRLIELAEGETP